MLNTSKIGTEHTGENNYSYAESVRYTYIDTCKHMNTHIHIEKNYLPN